jgi:LemA protein
MKKLYWVLLALLFVGGYVIGGVNTIPRLDEKVKAAWSEVDNQYQRRMDLIPNLVETVKGYAGFEKSTLTAVTEARASATKVTLTAGQLNDSAAFKQYQQAQDTLGTTLSRLLVASENYPELKANQQFIALQAQLEGTENRIAVARRDYIGVVQEFNTTVRTFPGLIWAKIYGAQPKETFAAAAGAEKAPAVKF